MARSKSLKQLTVENLERRNLLSGTTAPIDWGFAAGTLGIIGGDAAENVSVQCVNDMVIITVDGQNIETAVPCIEVESIQIDMGGGNDTVDLSGVDGISFRGLDPGAQGGSRIKVHGDAGNDWLFGDGGDDRIEAQAGNDYISGGNGNDSLAGEIGNDTLVGGTGANVLIGGQNDDTLVAGPGADDMRGGSGVNTLWYYQFTDLDNDIVRPDIQIIEPFPEII
jgi:Ca2+-binding RTX toxin-like protein